MTLSYKTLLISFLGGFVFAIGLIMAQMVDPNKVVAFLRVFHQWDPSLALVMGAAIVVAMPAFKIAQYNTIRHHAAWDGSSIALPTKTAITPQLLIGSALFGLGWGLLGFCPAPALVAAFAGYWQAMLFVLAMLVGFAIQALLEPKMSSMA